MLKEAEILTFVEGTTHYFETSCQQAATVGSPYLVTDGRPGTYEYTGVIGISGASSTSPLRAACSPCS